MLRTLLHLFLHSDQVATLYFNISVFPYVIKRHQQILIKEHKNSYLVRRKTNCEKIKTLRY